jgi:hypothetical protein
MAGLAERNSHDSDNDRKSVDRYRKADNAVVKEIKTLRQYDLPYSTVSLWAVSLTSARPSCVADIATSIRYLMISTHRGGVQHSLFARDPRIGERSHRVVKLLF